MEQGYFDKFFGAAQEIIDLAKKPLVRSQQKRKFRATYDDAVSQILDAESALTKMRENVKDIDIKGILEKRKFIDAGKRLQELIVEEYLLAFGKPMKVAEEED